MFKFKITFSHVSANLPVQDINNDFTVKHYGFYRIAYSERYLDNVFIKYSSGKMGVSHLFHIEAFKINTIRSCCILSET